MTSITARIAAAGVAMLLTATAGAAAPQERTRYSVGGMAPAGIALPRGIGPPLSGAVRAGDTL